MEEKKTETMLEYQKRIERVETAIRLEEPDRVPIIPFMNSIPERLFGSSYRDKYYNYERSGDATIEFYRKYPVDAHTFLGFTSGKANEVAGSTMIDWPGRPGSIVDKYSPHQVIEHEYLLQDEYREMLDDFTGFMLRKYIPRAFSGLKGLGGIGFTPTIVLSTSILSLMCTPEALEAFDKLKEVARHDAEAAQMTALYNEKLAEMGIPPLCTGASQAPFDILGDYFRGTVGILLDQLTHEDEIAEACDMFADQQIAALQYFKYVPLPVKRVFFPLHKGMDTFMSPRQYEKLYWQPLRKIVMALIDMGVTPFLCTEGKYESRLETIADLPRGKVIYHLEKVDMARAKKILGKVGAISGNLPIVLMAYGTREQVVDYVKYLMDTCAPGGGYLFDFDGTLDIAKPENLDALYEALDKYGKY